MRYEVTAWRPDTSADPDRTIDLLRTGAGDMTPDQVAIWIDAGHVFWVRGTVLTGSAIELKVGGTSRYGGRWVQTKPDGRYDNNIYALPKF